MAKDILEQHFGPETGSPVPHITDAKIALKNIVDSYGITTLEVSAHPLAEEQIVDSWPDEGIKE